MDSSVTVNLLMEKLATCKYTKSVIFVLPFLIPVEQCIPCHQESSTAVAYSILIKINDRSETFCMQGLACFISIFMLVESSLFKSGMLFWEVFLCFRADALKVFVSYFTVVFSFNLHIYYIPVFKNKWNRSPVWQLHHRKQGLKFCGLLWAKMCLYAAIWVA